MGMGMGDDARAHGMAKIRVGEFRDPRGQRARVVERDDIAGPALDDLVPRAALGVRIGMQPQTIASATAMPNPSDRLGSSAMSAAL